MRFLVIKPISVFVLTWDTSSYTTPCLSHFLTNTVYLLSMLKITFVHFVFIVFIFVFYYMYMLHRIPTHILCDQRESKFVYQDPVFQIRCGLRNCLKKHVAGVVISNCRVLDTCCVTDCNPTANLKTRIDALRAVTAKDSIHFLDTF